MAIKGMIRNWESACIQIAATSSLSGSLIHAGRPVIGIMMPDEWTAASVGFHVSACPGGTFRPLYSDDNELVVTEGNACRALSACKCLDKLAPWWAFKIMSGSVNTDRDDQAAARTFAIFYEG